MKKALFSILILIPTIAYAQSGIPCNIEVVKVANQNASNLTVYECLDFLKSIDPSCENNVEYSEFSNGTLFKLLECNPLILVRTIEKNKSNLHLDLIIDMIEEPLHDGFDLNKIKNQIMELEYESFIKSEIIKSLDIAINKLK